jgi:hypothetical protein
MIGKLKTVVLDTPDIAGLSAFYRGLAGWTEVYADDEWIALAPEVGWRIGFQDAPDHVPPRWPDPAFPQQAHLDLQVPDLDAATARAEELGATLLRENESWNTLADPAGHPFDLCLNADDPEITLMGVMLDCPDAKILSAFYAELLGNPVTPPVLFQQVESYTPPQWPDPAHPQQFHLDVLVDDIELAEPATLALGATRLPGEGDNWRVYADPAGKPFCLTWTVA